MCGCRDSRKNVTPEFGVEPSLENDRVVEALARLEPVFTAEDLGAVTTSCIMS
jgi:hypothetical protein